MATTIEEADLALEEFIEEVNERFAIEPAEPGLAYRAVPERFDLEEVFCFDCPRFVTPTTP